MRLTLYRSTKVVTLGTRSKIVLDFFVMAGGKGQRDNRTTRQRDHGRRDYETGKVKAQRRKRAGQKWNVSPYIDRQTLSHDRQGRRFLDFFCNEALRRLTGIRSDGRQ